MNTTTCNTHSETGSTKQRRNDMCKCGSKKKFKKCCLVHKQKIATVVCRPVERKTRQWYIKVKSW